MSVQTLITYSYLNEISGGDTEFQRDIVLTFLEEMVGEMDKMRQALAKQDWEVLGNVAHKMKAPIGMICVEVMRDLVLKIEKNSKNKVGLDEMPADVNQLLAYLDSSMEQLRADL
ncbi:MAG: Hpt domain-containing protein [Sphingobacteriaceae bacterium]|jgi:HPt (histidine-containing phosphotransfer) domain-containing protein|nr:Hpt domain-containing protein [Sphingobacteriaceae bacterium]